MAENMNSQPTELEELQIQAGQVADDSLQSTRRMLYMMEESEEAGRKTMEALNEQGEKLNNIERGMDDINADMTKAEKSLKRLKQCWCCSICSRPWKKVPTQTEIDAHFKNETRDSVIVDQPRRLYDERTANSSGNPTTGYITRITGDAREEEMDSNLCQVNNILGNLRNMAVDMNSELSQQNDQIGRITAKGDENSVRLDQVNISANKMITS